MMRRRNLSQPGIGLLKREGREGGRLSRPSRLLHLTTTSQREVPCAVTCRSTSPSRAPAGTRSRLEAGQRIGDSWNMHARILAALCAFSGLSAVLSCDGDTGNPNEPSTGLLQIITATMGETPAGSGYSYVLDDNPPKPIGFNTTIQLRGLS